MSSNPEDQDSSGCKDTFEFPKPLSNRAGMSSINYRIGTYSDFRKFFLQTLSNTTTLSDWSHYEHDDPGIALLESAAIICDILTFYQNLYANETKLNTAKWDESISDLVRITGYRLSPGIGGKATFAFDVRGDEPISIKPGFPLQASLEEFPQTVDFEVDKDIIVYPWLSKFNLFRPLKEVKITQDTNEFYIEMLDSKSDPVKLEEGDRLLVGDVHPSYPAPPGSELLNVEIVIVDKIRELHGQLLFTIKGKLMKRIGDGSNNLAAYKLGRTFHHFGYNSLPKVLVTKDKDIQEVTISSIGSTNPPPKVLVTKDNDIKEVAISYIRPTISEYDDDNSWFWKGDINLSTIFNYKKIIAFPHLDLKEFPLNNEVDDISPGTTFLVQSSTFVEAKEEQPPSGSKTRVDSRGVKSPGIVDSKLSAGLFMNEMPSVQIHEINVIEQPHTFIRTVQEIRSAHMTFGAISGNSTIITIDNALTITKDGSSYNTMDIRNMLFHEVLSPILTLKAKSKENLEITRGEILNFYGTEKQAETLKNRNLLFVPPVGDPFKAFVARVSSVDSLSASFGNPNLHQITLKPEIQNYDDFPNENSKVTVYGNLVETTQGKSQASLILGNGDSRQIFQTFKLPKSPLTYKISAEEIPPEIPELRIYVDNILWKYVSSLFGHGPKDRVYIVRQDANGDSWIQFGDGKSYGSNLPSGIDNIVAEFRTGLGAFGHIKSGTTVQAGDRIENLNNIQLLDVVSGGSSPEIGENARNAAPGKIQSMNRLISIADFESEARSLSGVSKASARLGIQKNIPTIILTILMENGREREFEDMQKRLSSYDRRIGMQRYPILVSQSKLQPVFVYLDYGYDSTFNKKEVERLINGALGVNEEGERGGVGVGEGDGDFNNLRGLFGIQNRNFGEVEYLSRIEGVVQNVEGVEWVRVTKLGHLTDSQLVTRVSISPVTTRKLTSDKPIEHISVSKRLDQIISCNENDILVLNSKDLRINGVPVLKLEMN